MEKHTKTAKAAKPNGILPFTESISIFSECIAIFGDEGLRGGNFPPYMTIKPVAFDAEDQHVALQRFVDIINAANDCDATVKKMRDKLQSYFGPIDRPFSAVLRGWKYLIIPKVSLH